MTDPLFVMTSRGLINLAAVVHIELGRPKRLEPWTRDQTHWR